MAEALKLNILNSPTQSRGLKKPGSQVGGRLPEGQVAHPMDQVVISQPSLHDTVPENNRALLDIQEPFLPEELIGKAVGVYTIKGILGSGGMGTVYLAEGPNGDVALKVMDHNSLGANTGMFFKAEVDGLQEAKGLRNNLQIIDHGQVGNFRYIVTEYLPDAVPVGDLYGQSMSRTLGLFRDAAVGLANLHARGWVHRDVKSGNIMAGKQGTVIDFGLAAPMNETFRDDGAIFGTPSHISPEQLKGHQLTPASDLFSLGISLNRSLTGNSPFPMRDDADFLNYKDLAPSDFGSLPAKLRYWVMPELLALDPKQRLQEGAFLAEDLDYVAEHMAYRADRFNGAIDAGRAAAAESGAPTAGTIVFFPAREINPLFEDLVNRTFTPEKGDTVLRSDSRDNKGLFVYSRSGKAEILTREADFFREAGEVFYTPFVTEEVETNSQTTGEELYGAKSNLVKKGRIPSAWENMPGSDTAIDDGSASVTSRTGKRSRSVAGTEAPTSAGVPAAKAAVSHLDSQKAATLALAALYGRELAGQINDQMAYLDHDKLGGLERELQAQVRLMSNQEFADMMKEAGVLKNEAIKIKAQLDSFEFKQLKTGFVSLASGLLSMTAVSYLISKLSPDMNPGLHFAVVMLGGHYTKNGVTLLANRIRNKEFMSGVRELVGNVKNGRIIVKGLGRGALAALKAPLITGAKAAELVGKGILAGVKSTHGMGLGTLTAAGWKYLMDGMGVKNVYVREGGEMAAFLLPDVAKLSARYLVTVKGFQTLSQLMAKGALGTAAKAANVVGWAAFAADLTIGGIEHGMIKDAYTRSIIARAKEDWKNAQDGFFSIAGTMALDGLIGSFADAVVPQNYLDKVSARDDQAVVAFMEEVGKGVFLASLSGGSLEEVKGHLAGCIKQFGATPQGKEYFEGMQAFIKIKYGTNMTVGQKLLTELDVASPVITDKLLEALLVESTFDGKYVKAQLRAAAKAVEAGLPQS